MSYPKHCILLCHLLAGMDFNTDGFWPVISHQLINQSFQILLNKVLALRLQWPGFLTGVVQLVFDCILRESVSLVKAVVKGTATVIVVLTGDALVEIFFFTLFMMYLHIEHLVKICSFITPSS